MVPTEKQRPWAEAKGAEAKEVGNGRVTYVEIPETGHILPVEPPVEVAGAIVAWLCGRPG